LQKIAGDVASVDLGHSHIQHMSRSIEAQVCVYMCDMTHVWECDVTHSCACDITRSHIQHMSCSIAAQVCVYMCSMTYLWACDVTHLYACNITHLVIRTCPPLLMRSFVRIGVT